MTIRITIEDVDQVKETMKAHPEMKATKMDGNSETGQPMIFDVILDVSQSMNSLFNELVDCFNDIMIPALKGVCAEQKNALRLGCMLFSDKLIPAWPGYKSLKELGAKPLKRSAIDQPGLNGCTALYGAMRAGILWTAAAMDFMREEGRGGVPKGKVIVLTDGANNLEPQDITIVKKTMDEISKINARNLQRVIGYFNTGSGLTEDQFNALVNATCFEGLGFYDIAKGNNPKEQQASFRHHFGVFSRKSAKAHK